MVDNGNKRLELITKRKDWKFDPIEMINVVVQTVLSHTESGYDVHLHDEIQCELVKMRLVNFNFITVSIFKNDHRGNDVDLIKHDNKVEVEKQL